MEKNNEWKECTGNQGLWLPTEKGATIEGEVVEIKQGQYGLQLTIADVKGNKVQTPSHRALQARLNEFVIGDGIKIVFLGVDLPKIKGQSGVHLYQAYRKPGLTDVEVV
jgi:hypothetical protein